MRAKLFTRAQPLAAPCELLRRERADVAQLLRAIRLDAAAVTALAFLGIIGGAYAFTH